MDYRIKETLAKVEKDNSRPLNPLNILDLAASINVSLTGSLCLGTGVTDISVNLGSQKLVYCPGGNVAFRVQPDTIDALNPPAAMTISGSGIEDTYGAPIVAFYNEFGNVVSSAPASQTFAGDGSPRSGPGIESLTVNGSDLSQVYDGTYSIAVNNVNSDGIWTTIGAGMVSVYGNPPPPPDPGDLGGGCETQPQDQPQLECSAY